MRSPFNSVFEISLRTIILLVESDRSLCEEEIFAADFIATYGHAFSITESNLHGDNRFMFSEARVRRHLINASLKELVLTGHIFPSVRNGTIYYEPTNTAKSVAHSLDTDYASEYKDAAKRAVNLIDQKGVSTIVSEIEYEDKRD